MKVNTTKCAKRGTKWNNEELHILVVVAQGILTSYGGKTYNKDQVWRYIKQVHDEKEGARQSVDFRTLRNKYNVTYRIPVVELTSLFIDKVKNGETTSIKYDAQNHCLTVPSGTNNIDAGPRCELAEAWHNVFEKVKTKFAPESYARGENKLFDYYFDNDVPWQNEKTLGRQPAVEVEAVVMNKRKQKKEEIEEADGEGEVEVTDPNDFVEMETPAQQQPPLAQQQASLRKTQRGNSRKASRVAKNEEDNDEKIRREAETKALNDLSATVNGLVESKNARLKIERLKEKKAEWEQKPDSEPMKAERLAKINKMLNEASGLGVWAR
mmetsp:Transcript_6203/g.18416  ORF Transcript_6203/g.18416 Transcript_6203/m.18416 type:complete len:325 (-) Transcript_6203:35-1009(-)